MRQRAYGFTIVELLIVIVVVAILAALSYVGYTNISNRANDSVVQADLRNWAGKIQEYYAIHGEYPHAGYASGVTGVPFSVARSSYSPDVHNVIYCKSSIEGEHKFIVVGASKSGNRFAYSTDAGAHSYANTWGSVVNICTQQGWTGSSSSGNLGFGYNGTTGTWFNWTQ